jgi:acetyltransferase-like isoleucine patch superfamily enzyme
MPAGSGGALMDVTDRLSWVSPRARLGVDVRLGHFVVIRDNVAIGDRCQIGDHAVLGMTTTVARSSTLAKLQGLPGQAGRAGRFGGVGQASEADLVHSPEQTSQVSATDSAVATVRDDELWLHLGNDCVVGPCALLYVGSTVGEGTFIADGAQIRERCVLGRNVIVGHNATVENDCAIGDNTRIQTGAYITAFTTIEDHVFIAPMVVTTNDNYMGRTEERFKHRRGAIIRRGARIGAGAVILPGVEIGQEAVVAAGSVVTRNVPPYSVVMGCPARVVRDVPAEQVLFPRTSV